MKYCSADAVMWCTFRSALQDAQNYALQHAETARAENSLSLSFSLRVMQNCVGIAVPRQKGHRCAIHFLLWVSSLRCNCRNILSTFGIVTKKTRKLAWASSLHPNSMNFRNVTSPCHQLHSAWSSTARTTRFCTHMHWLMLLFCTAGPPCIRCRPRRRIASHIPYNISHTYQCMTP